MKSLCGIIFLGILIIFQTTLFGQNGSGLICSNAEPLCGSSSFAYPNTSGFNLAEEGPDYGCLLLARNPAWFYFQIDQPGDIQLKIEQSTNIGNAPDLDVDFVVYGPFNDPLSPCSTDLISSNISDCSYRLDFVEYLNLNDTKSGEYYLLMITNFSLRPGYITVTQTDGAATTNCILVEEPILMESTACVNTMQTLDATTPNATHYQWYQEDSDENYIEIYGEETAFLNVSNEGIYKAEALNARNVVIEHYQFNFSFLDSSPLEINAEVISKAFIEENDIEVAVINGLANEFEYSMDRGDWQDQPIFYNVSMGEHEISVINSTGCRMGTTKITVMDYPLYFTPNGDGFNDTWNINGLKNQLQASIYIYDRYGKLIKQIIPSSQGWDGSFNGTPMPTSDYWFTVTFIEPRDGTLQSFNAHFTLKR